MRTSQKDEFRKRLDGYPPYMSEEDICLDIVLKACRRDIRFLLKVFERVSSILQVIMSKLVHNNKIINENAFYLERYLSGNLYIDEESARKNLPIQLEHAQKILELSEEK